MNTARRLISAFVITLVLSLGTLAGDMATPKPSTSPALTGDMDTPKSPVFSAPGAGGEHKSTSFIEEAVSEFTLRVVYHALFLV